MQGSKVLRVPSLLTGAGVALALGVATVATAAAAARERGKVRYVTARRAYLDAGKLEGLKLGDALELFRGGHKAATCKIDQLADHSASCFADARVGDSFARPSTSAAAPAPPPRAQSTPAIEPTAAQARLAEVPVEKVDFKPSKTMRGGDALPLVTASIGHTAFVTFGGGQFEQESVDLALNGLDMRFGGFRAYAHLTALIYSQRPNNVRFRPGDVFQLYVWDLEASSREVGRSFVASVGRIWPYNAPGLTLVDGAQVGWRSRSGDAEVGVLGGTIPEAMTLYPSARWLGGFYYGVSYARPRKTWFRLFRHEARLSLRETVANGPLLEFEALAQAWVQRTVDVGADARASMGMGDWRTPHFDAARISIGLHPLANLRGLMSFRYLDSRTVDPDALMPSFFSTGRWYYADVDMAYSPLPWISVSVLGGAAYEVEGLTLGREYLGGEFAFPLLFGGIGGLSIGYREELGWMSGRTAYLGLNASLSSRFRFLSRASFFDDTLATNNELREIGLYGMLDARLYRWLSLRASALSRVQLTPGSGSGGTNVGLVARGELVGAW
jgi:hypothetical protein